MKLSLVGLTLCSIASLHAQSLTAGRYEQNITVGGLSRSYILDVPPSYNPSKAMPVVVVLHSWSTTAAQAENYTRMKIKGEEDGFISVFPEGINKSWNAGFFDLTGSHPDDVAFLTAVLDSVEKQVKVDLNREYVCGHSNGAFMAYLAGSRLSTRLAAVGGVSGTIGIGDKKIPAPDAPISVIMINGVLDPKVAYDSSSKASTMGIGAIEGAEWWAGQDGCGPSPTVTKSADGNVTTRVYAEGKGDSVVELVSIANGKHAWPGGWTMDEAGHPIRETATGADAGDLLWAFFRAHPKG